MDKKNFEVGFKITFQGTIVVEAVSDKDAAERVKQYMAVTCCMEGEDALEVESYTHVHSVEETSEVAE